MAIYTFQGLKRSFLEDLTSSVKFSTGKEMAYGEAVDLTAQEVTEAQRTGIILTAGTVSPTKAMPPVIQKKTVNGKVVSVTPAGKVLGA